MRPIRWSEVGGDLEVGEAFVIIQIGNAELDRVYRDAIVPALTAAGLTPRRVDIHNSGGLLQNEIAAFIERAEIIVADLTNERPNCYLEVGYALGLGKLGHILLAAREDHQPDLPNRQPNDPRVHFDLNSYDILYWDPDDLPDYSSRLETRVRRRLLITGTTKPTPVWDDSWIADMRKRATEGLEGHE